MFVSMRRSDRGFITHLKRKNKQTGTLGKKRDRDKVLYNKGSGSMDPGGPCLRHRHLSHVQNDWYTIPSHQR